VPRFFECLQFWLAGDWRKVCHSSNAAAGGNGFPRSPGDGQPKRFRVLRWTRLRAQATCASFLQARRAVSHKHRLFFLAFVSTAVWAVPWACATDERSPVDAPNGLLADAGSDVHESSAEATATLAECADAEAGGHVDSGYGCHDWEFPNDSQPATSSVPFCYGDNTFIMPWELPCGSCEVGRACQVPVTRACPCPPWVGARIDEWLCECRCGTWQCQVVGPAAAGDCFHCYADAAPD
jgi:hypothetical protein